MLYTQPTTSFLKFCNAPLSVQSLIAVDSYMLTDRQVDKLNIYYFIIIFVLLKIYTYLQAFYLSGCSSTLSFHKNDPKFVLGLKYMIKAIPVSSLLNIDAGIINYQVTSHLISIISDHNLPMALHLLNITDPGEYY